MSEEDGCHKLRGRMMIDKAKFLEMLSDLTEIAATQGNILTPEEIKEYFRELELTEEHYTLIYSFLSEKQVEVPGIVQAKSEEEDNKGLNQEDSIYLKMYRKELRNLEKYTPEQEKIIMREVQNEIPGAREKLINAWLPKVVRMANKYKNQGVYLEDLIQEGNIGLLSGVDNLALLGTEIDGEEYLKEQILREIERVIDENTEEEDNESIIVGRSNLIQEASRVLAEDLGRVATLSELAEYTRLSEEEIQNIRTLSRNSINVGKGE